MTRVFSLADHLGRLRWTMIDIFGQWAPHSLQTAGRQDRPQGNRRRAGPEASALAALAHLALQGPNAMMSTFQQHQKLIQRIAEHNTGRTSLTAAAKLPLILRIWTQLANSWRSGKVLAGSPTPRAASQPRGPSSRSPKSRWRTVTQFMLSPGPRLRCSSCL